MDYTLFWTLPGESNKTYPVLPSTQIDGLPIPTTWAGVGEDKAKELGAVKHRMEIVPPAYSIPEGVNPYSVTTIEDMQVHTLDLSALNFDEAAATEAKAIEVRTKRDTLLRASDWSQLADSPLDSTAMILWQSYRQALRDVPQQPGFPADLEWPQQPTPE